MPEGMLTPACNLHTRADRMAAALPGSIGRTSKPWQRSTRFSKTADRRVTATSSAHTSAVVCRDAAGANALRMAVCRSSSASSAVLGTLSRWFQIARAAQAAGHSVGVACEPSLVPIVEAGGFAAFGIGPLPPARPPRRMPLKEVDMAREERDLRKRFADTAARVRAEGVLRLARAWRSDVIVADEVDFGSVLAAEMLDVPYATVLVIAAGNLVRSSVVADTLDRVRSEYGLPSDPDLAAPSRYLVLSPFPLKLRDPAFPLPATAHMFRSVEVSRADSAAPWPLHLAGAPSVYFTLGTEFNLESGDLFSRVLAGLRQLPVNVLVTVGRQIDPSELGEQPANVHVERYLPQAEILPHCQLVVSHGGSGTLMEHWPTACRWCSAPWVPISPPTLGAALHSDSVSA